MAICAIVETLASATCSYQNGCRTGYVFRLWDHSRDKLAPSVANKGRINLKARRINAWKVYDDFPGWADAHDEGVLLPPWHISPLPPQPHAVPKWHTMHHESAGKVVALLFAIKDWLCMNAMMVMHQ